MATRKTPRGDGRPAGAVAAAKARNSAPARGTAGSPAIKPARGGAAATGTGATGTAAARQPRAAVPASKAAAGRAASKGAAARATGARTAAGTSQTRDVRNGQVTEPAAKGTGSRAAGYARAHKLEFATLVIAVLGFADSLYLTIEHFTGNTTLACSGKGVVNCGAVTTSAQSHVLGIPVAVLGLAFFVFMVAATSPPAWRSRQPIVHWARLGSVIVGIGFVIYLIYAELFLIGAICLYCTAVHVLTFLLFALLVTRAAGSGIAPRREPARVPAASRR